MKTITIYASMTAKDAFFDLSSLERRDREFGYFSLSYHYVITRDGWIENGRPEERTSPHEGDVVICLIGGADKNGGPYDNFTDEQKTSLIVLLDRLQKRLGLETQVISKTPSVQQGLLDSLFNQYAKEER